MPSITFVGRAPNDGSEWEVEIPIGNLTVRDPHDHLEAISRRFFSPFPEFISIIE
jgi:hypothetical protein